MESALELFTAAAEAGSVNAMEFMGEFCAEGYGVMDVDYAQAAEWYQQAAALGEEHAAQALADLSE